MHLYVCVPVSQTDLVEGGMAQSTGGSPAYAVRTADISVHMSVHNWGTHYITEQVLVRCLLLARCKYGLTPKNCNKTFLNGLS